jgi:hypothetical protein
MAQCLWYSAELADGSARLYSPHSSLYMPCDGITITTAAPLSHCQWRFGFTAQGVIAFLYAALHSVSHVAIYHTHTPKCASQPCVTVLRTPVRSIMCAYCHSICTQRAPLHVPQTVAIEPTAAPPDTLQRYSAFVRQHRTVTSVPTPLQYDAVAELDRRLPSSRLCLP